MFLILISLAVSPAKADVSYSLVGDAFQLSAGDIRLTRDLQDKHGAMWATDRIDLSKDFEFRYRIKLGHHDSGGSGIAFVLQRSGLNVVGGKGGALGINGIGNNFYIEFDTFNSGANRNDISNDHFSVVS